MDGQFQVERGPCRTKQGGYEAVPTLESKRPGQGWRFVDEFQQLLGDDSEADSQFFVETWTFGMAAAVENYQSRRKRQAGRETQGHAFSELDDLVTLSCGQESDEDAEFPSPVEAATYVGRGDIGRSRGPAEGSGGQQRTYGSGDAKTLDEEFDDSEETARPMSLSYACDLLGVGVDSTRQEIRAAYRRKVSKWHPDRLDRGSEQMRQRATAHMAAINEAYRLLCSELTGK